VGEVTLIADRKAGGSGASVGFRCLGQALVRPTVPVQDGTTRDPCVPVQPRRALLSAEKLVEAADCHLRRTMGHVCRGVMTQDSKGDTSSDIAAWQWRQIVNGATDTAIITTDVQGRVTSWNKGASNILGWSASDILGKSLGHIFTEEDQEAQLRREIKDAVSTGKGGGEEGWRYRKDGSRLWAVGELSPIRDGSEIVGFIKILRDRTAQWEAEEIIREERHALEVLNRAGSGLAQETDLAKFVQIVTDAGVELSGAEFGAFFYNVINSAGESYMLYTLSGAPIEAFAKFPMPRNTEVFAPTFGGTSIVRSDDITKDPRYGKNAPRRGMPEGHLPVRSYLAVPVVSRTGEVLGGLFFGHAKTGMFNERSERGLSGLAAEAAVAIDNVRLSPSCAGSPRRSERDVGTAGDRAYRTVAKKRGSSTSVSEDGSCRSVDWRCGARFQQSVAGDHRQSRHASTQSAQGIRPTSTCRQTRDDVPI
jgi:PAS domain S-box-containing protein